ncbi:MULTISPECIES: hypothetical protein [Pseudomonas]|uniref:hypothetical protein n=1 Tax=Pseudomonas TaxID=286 RepID=UPI002580AA0D|nr:MULTISPECIES: hypothetical protein [Pseudomonas]
MTKPIKERPVLFSAPMVRAILEGRKTVTRREVKKQAALDCLAAGFEPAFLALPGNSDLCPYGRQGDRLWVRETWQDVHPIQVSDGRYSQTGRAGIPGPPGVTYQTIYRADGPYPKVFHTHHHPYRGLEPHPDHGFKAPADSGYTGWTPSIHMPRWASRILLEITDVRVERLREGEGETAFESRYIAEGIHRIHHGDGEYYYHPFSSEPGPGNWIDPYDAWRELWVAINGAESWNNNPWVWVVEFKQVMP